jgi:hypothetical protein
MARRSHFRGAALSLLRHRERGGAAARALNFVMPSALFPSSRASGLLALSIPSGSNRKRTGVPFGFAQGKLSTPAASARDDGEGGRYEVHSAS